MPLNWNATIDFGWCEAGDELKPASDFQSIRKRVWSWWDYKRKKGLLSGPFLDWVTWEAPNGNHHANWKMHIPEEFHEEITFVIKDRAEKVLGTLEYDVIQQEKIWNLNGTMFYALKGTEEHYAKDIEIIPKPQGLIWSRRASAARALGPAARERDWANGRIIRAPTKGLPMPAEARAIVRTGGTIKRDI
ncbi:hypothetical protein LQ948_04145 [Jiella sp. MQZ9-1]|uniref:Uncharacterized protein n=1 Tax=Jiella flava TaxID=2816857 RepID=A0A939FYM3_9HYPH|nr:hypothetical protein [Jiella flava]MBO0661754.1 hypothetical protein [Jiella flava]MCD2470395.1 hypothetical protein [Jiella flava]